ncbi:GDP-D-glucose phosphorylase 1 [Apus apus]|uniref:GDP-D-glucose phosphorylase 1 n=1 Tax=Apus apus TaxID=8895 RepID=UPI0021F8944E|nr:GDP-D-glucose phosphorylase 1 [Apus apus]
MAAAGEAPRPEELLYGEQELVPEAAGWGHEPGSMLSRFDQALLAGWSDRMERGLFRYRLGALPTRLLPGPMGLVAQLNAQRGTQRRPPQPVCSLRQPFNPQDFNFTRIHPDEVLFCLRRAGDGCHAAPDPLLVAINASPLERGHVLLLPEPARGLPQALTAAGLRGALEALLLSTHPGFRVGFNGLGGYASVNHLHFHGLYLPRPLLVESVPAQPLCPPHCFSLLRDVPAPAFLFYAAGPAELEALARDMCRAAEHVAEAGLACNLFATRGDPPAGPGGRRGLRVLLWARRPSFGAKASTAFNVALCELAGYLPLPSEPLYREMTEAEALRNICEPLLPEPELLRLGRALARLLVPEGAAPAAARQGAPRGAGAAQLLPT